MYTGIQFTNNASTQLTKSLASTGTEITVADNAASVFPKLVNTGDYFILTLSDIYHNYEVVKCTSRTDSVFTVERAQEGTTATTFPAGSKVELRLTAASLVKVAEDASTVKPHASDTSSTVGKATAQTYGHVKLTDTFDTGGQAVNGIACSPAAFQQAVTRLINASKVTTITQSTTWIAPETANYTITAVGGGGNGGAGGNGFVANDFYVDGTAYFMIGGGAGGGGGAGQVVTKQVYLNKGDSVNITIGGSGGTTTFGSYVTASGGGNGSNGSTGYYSVSYEQVCGYNGDSPECWYKSVFTPHAGVGGSGGTTFGSSATAGNSGSIGDGWTWGYGGKVPGIGGTSTEGTYGNGGTGGAGGDGCNQYLDAQTMWITPGKSGNPGTQGCVKITVKLS